MVKMVISSARILQKLLETQHTDIVSNPQIADMATNGRSWAGLQHLLAGVCNYSICWTISHPAGLL